MAAFLKFMAILLLVPLCSLGLAGNFIFVAQLPSPLLFEEGFIYEHIHCQISVFTKWSNKGTEVSLKNLYDWLEIVSLCFPASPSLAWAGGRIVFRPLCLLGSTCREKRAASFCTLVYLPQSSQCSLILQNDVYWTFGLVFDLRKMHPILEH